MAGLTGENAVGVTGTIDGEIIETVVNSETMRLPPSPPRHVHTPTLVCHVPRYQYITERPPETLHL